MKYEEIPDEELWEDGEIQGQDQMMRKLYYRVCVQGNWAICRRIEE